MVDESSRPRDAPSSEEDSNDTSPALARMLDDFGLDEVGGSGLDEASLRPDSRIADRYVIRRVILGWEGGAFLLVHDEMLDRSLVLKRTNADDIASAELQRQELVLARALSHPNVCRVHDLLDFEAHRYLVMEPFDGTLRQQLDRWRSERTAPTMDEVRRIVGDVATGLAAVHERGLVHGALNPENVVLRDGSAAVLFGPATERERILSGAPLTSLKRIEPPYFSLERLAEGHTSRTDDVFALGLMLFELLAGRTPDTGVNPRDEPLLRHVDPEVSVELSVSELFLLYRCLDTDAQRRPRAKHVRLGDDTPPLNTGTIDPGTPTGHGERYEPGTHHLLVTVATTAPHLVGTLHSLKNETVELGRHGADIALAERTLSSRHASLRYERGTWRVEDLESSNGTYFDQSEGRRDRGVLRLGDEVQLGELRVMLVSFAPNSPQHWRARRHLDRHDGLTGTLTGAHYLQAAEEMARFSNWSHVPCHLVKLELALSKHRSATELMVGTRRCIRHWLVELGRRWSGIAACGLLRPHRCRPGGTYAFRTVLCGRQGDVAQLVDALCQEVNQVAPGVCELKAEVRTRENEDDVLDLLG